MKRNPNISRWLENQITKHEKLAAKHEKAAHEFREAMEQYQRTAKLPQDVRQKWDSRKTLEHDEKRF